MSTPPFGRVLTAMVTPFGADGSLDLDTAARLARHLVDAGNDGLVVNGTTGESPTTSDEEKAALVRTVVEAVGDRAFVVAGAGTNETRHSRKLAVEAAEAGAHGLLLVTPYYNKPPQEGVYRHFTTVADATDLPVMIYDIPGRSVVPIHTETLVRLADHPRIVAVKDAKGDLWASTKVMSRTDLAYYSGDDGATLSQVTQGAVGVVGVTSHVAAGRYVELVEAATSGDLPRAIRIHRELVPATEAVMSITQGAIMAKAALVETGVLENGSVRLPLVEPTPEQREALRSGLAASGLLQGVAR